ncbi:hypothetical protein FPV67DRAFT_1696229 [Lyophyllum atratum]|nr:hypothetical protein FPV67DRAFT_1696229 [Lyophyllum atratum]
MHGDWQTFGKPFNVEEHPDYMIAHYRIPSSLTITGTFFDMGNGQKKCTVHIFFTERSLQTKLSASSSSSLGDLRKAIHDKAAAHMTEMTLWKNADMDEHLNQSLESIILSADRHGSNSFDSADNTTLLKDLSPALTSGSVLYAIIPSLLKPNLGSPPAATDWVRDADTLSSPVHDFLETVVKVGSKDRKEAKAAKQKAEKAEDNVTKMLKRLDQEANERQEAKRQWEQQRQEMKRQWEQQRQEMKRQQEAWEAEKKELKDRIGVLEVGTVDMVEWLVHEDTQALDRIKLRNLLDKAQAKLAFETDLIKDEKTTSASYQWRLWLNQWEDDQKRFDNAKSALDALTRNLAICKLLASEPALRLVVEKNSKIRGYGDQAAHGFVSAKAYQVAVDRYSDVDTKEGLKVLITLVCGGNVN